MAQAQGARISVRDAVLPFGAFGRWVRYPDGQEVFEVAVGLAARDWTVAHELGHLMLRHDHQGRGGCASAHRRAERDAERFASLITSRIEAARRAPRESIFL
ncbi:hypothetical protein AXK56_16340 [Tsukamurella pulmonis]|nr:hypothetical protein AXK56_16340 [Tsukamurella pulmonis]